MVIDAKPLCPSCRQPVESNSPLGLCPACLIKSGLNTHNEGVAEAALDPASDAAEEIARCFPQLDVLGLIGKGGMGRVYKVRQRQLDRLAALKVLPLEAGPRSDFAERFSREAKALARLNHPNIVAIYDFGQQNGFYYFLMEYVDGVNLRQLERSRRPTAEEALSIVPAICDALQYAHQQGIVHRDVKPENILIDKQGRVKIADFGIAKVLGAERKGLTLTQDRQTMGTPHYMAPEQVERPGAVDHRADIYSLGVVFYELLTGELPLGKFAPPSAKAPLDTRLDGVVLKALEKEPEKRYQQASEVKTEVQTIASEDNRVKTGKLPGPEAPSALAAAWKRRSEFVRDCSTVTRTVIAVSCVVLLLGLVTLAWNTYKGGTDGQRQRVGPLSPGNMGSAQRTVTPEEIRTTSIQEWFSRLGRDAELGYAPFASLNAIIAKAKESDPGRDEIIRRAAETIDDQRQDPFKRWQCCYVLSGIGDGRGIAAVTRALKDGNSVVRGVAACALGAFDQPEAKAALEAARAGERDPQVVQAIEKALRGEFRKPKT